MRRSERGAATVLVVAMAGVLMFVMTGLAAAGGLLGSLPGVTVSAEAVAVVEEPG